MLVCRLKSARVEEGKHYNREVVGTMEWLGKLFARAKGKQEPPEDNRVSQTQKPVPRETLVETPGYPPRQPGSPLSGEASSLPKQPEIPSPQESEPSMKAQQEKLGKSEETPGVAETSGGLSAPVPEGKVLPAQSSKDREEEKMVRTQDTLNKLLMTEGVNGVIVASLDGFLIGSAGRTGTDVEAIGILASSEVSVALTLEQEALSGALSQIILEYSNGRVVLESLGEGLILVVIGTSQSNLGMLRLAINNLKEEVIRSLN
jgi:predicted regulator of Ras-like GTPase activity (Roadblock/LC7/MglB family)